MTLKTHPFDVAEYLETDGDIHLFLQAALEEGSEEEFVHALATAARAKGMTEVAQKAGLSRDSLSKSLAEGGKPLFNTICKETKALGYLWPWCKLGSKQQRLILMMLLPPCVMPSSYTPGFREGFQGKSL